MRRIVFLLAVVTALALVGGVALAEPQNGKGTKAGPEIKALKTGAESVPTEGLMAPLPTKNGKIDVEDSSAEGVAGATATQAKWLSGTSSNTHYWNPITSQMQLLTTEFISYWGTEDATYPKVGELYWGKITIGNVNPSMSTPVMGEVELPPNTKFSLVDGDPNMKITCILDNFNTGQSQQLTGDLCPQAPKQPGTYEPYQLSPKGGYWTIRPGEAISVIFPIYSTSELKGWAGTPPHCLSGSVWAAASWEVWDKPEVGDSCPVSNGDGVDQGVWVAPNPPTVEYPTPSATKITGTGATTTGHLFYHFQPGTAYLDLGTTTSYGRTVSLSIPNTHDALAVSNDWTGLNPDTTYHWRLRYTDQQGHTVNGADQTFRTAPDTVAPRVTRVIPTENAKGVGPGTNVTAYFSEPMKAATVTANFKLYKAGTTKALAATVAYDPATSKATLNPSTKLQLGKKYKAEVSAATRDLAGNPLDQDPNLTGNQPKTWFFTVKN